MTDGARAETDIQEVVVEIRGGTPRDGAGINRGFAALQTLQGDLIDAVTRANALQHLATALCQAPALAKTLAAMDSGETLPGYRAVTRMAILQRAACDTRHALRNLENVIAGFLPGGTTHG